MHSSANKQSPLAKAKRPPQPRRAVSKKDFHLPKPYRRQLFSEEPERLTRMQVSVLSFAALIITTSLGVLALLAHESDLSPEGKMIVVVARLETVEAADVAKALPTAADALAAVAIAPALPHEPPVSVPADAVTDPPVTRMHVAEKSRVKSRPPLRVASAPRKTPAARFAVALLGRGQSTRLPRQQLAVTVPAPDPDVALIAAILLLTPVPVPAFAPPVAIELAGRAQTSCAPVIPKDLACTELAKLKP